MTDSNPNVKEVSIVKRSTTMTSEDYFSITLKSAEDTVENLLKKAVLATTSSQQKIRESQIPIH
jgi:hypothetical protein